MVIREEFLKKLRTYIDAPLVKILAGIRRCGKSTILEMLHAELINKGIDENNIISKRYTSFEIADCYTAKDMYNDIKKEIVNDNRYYLLLDEVQEVDGWEKAVNSLLEGANVDIYVTGSNSKLMSSEISTYLTGRYVLIPVYPLSFKEYLDFKSNRHVRQALCVFLNFQKPFHCIPPQFVHMQFLQDHLYNKWRY